MFRLMTLAFVLALSLALPSFGQDSDNRNKHLDITSSVGDLHVSNDGDAHKAGLPLYPGSRLKSDGDNNDAKNDAKNSDANKNDQANLSLFTDAFGMKLVVAQYVSDDAPAKVVDFYRDKLKKYGKVLECHSQKHGGNISVHDDKDSKDQDNKESKELKFDENSGPVTELKVGTEDNQHIVAVEQGDSGKGSKFALVYLRTRGKRGEI
jgi:hypothetical protein